LKLLHIKGKFTGRMRFMQMFTAARRCALLSKMTAWFKQILVQDRIFATSKVSRYDICTKEISD
jgi:hypothetical protein